MPELESVRTVSEAATDLGISPMRVRQRINAGEIVATKVGNQYVITKAQIAKARNRPDGRGRGKQKKG